MYLKYTLKSIFYFPIKHFFITRKLWVNNNNLNDNSKTGSDSMANKGSDIKAGAGAGVGAGAGAGAGTGNRRASLLQQVETMQKMNKTVLTLAARR